MQSNTTLLPAKKLLDQVRDNIRYKHYSLSREETYISWIKQYMLFISKRHPTEMGAAGVETFLTCLATERHVSSSTIIRHYWRFFVCIVRYPYDYFIR